MMSVCPSVHCCATCVWPHIQMMSLAWSHRDEMQLGRAKVIRHKKDTKGIMNMMQPHKDVGQSVAQDSLHEVWVTRSGYPHSLVDFFSPPTLCRVRGWYTTKQKLWKVMLENKDYNADLVFKIVKRGINSEAISYCSQPCPATQNKLILLKNGSSYLQDDL